MQVVAVAVLCMAVSSRAACADEGTETACMGLSGCLWDVAWAPDLCTRDPCVANINAQTCESAAVEFPFPCQAPAGDPDFCFVNVCVFDPQSTQECSVRACLYQEGSTCSAGGCNWAGEPVLAAKTPSPADLVLQCREDFCAGLDANQCFSRGGCEQDGALCTMKACGAHQVELECNHDRKCHWDLTAAYCRETQCGQIGTKASCDSNAQCMYDEKYSACVPKSCDKYNHPVDRCACADDQECTWNQDSTHPHCTSPTFNACPDLDIAFVLDGSGSMRRSFGNHVHGFYGLMEIMRDWVKVVPLTGDDHTVGAAASTGTGEFRMTFIQFSKAEARPDEDHPTGCAVGQCTDGHLSGRRDELYGDLDWHEANYQAQWTYMHAALQDVADNTFTPDQSPAGRQHVVIIVADGGLTDIDGDACCEDRCGNPRCVDTNWRTSYPGALDAAQAKLRTEDVTVFGIVMRRFDYHTFQDDNAEAKLTPLVTEPVETHFLNLMLDDIPTTVLDRLCDPSSVFGKTLLASKTGSTTGCSLLAEADCGTSSSCVWDSASVKCEETVCYPLCNQDTCEKNAMCQWSSDKCVLVPSGCAGKTQQDCLQDDTCLWNALWADSCIDNPCRPFTQRDACLGHAVTIPAPCDAPAGDPDFCKLDVCRFTPSNSPTTCDVTACLKVSQATCEAEDGCVWNAPSPIPSTASPSDKVGYCNPQQCRHDTQMDCDQDALCLWDGMGSRCVEASCTKHKNEVDCDRDMSCHWNAYAPTPICTPTVCAVHTAQDPCDADSQCQWDASNVCVPKNCNKHADQCPCDADSDCVWHHAANGAYCTAVQFNACPDLDIAFVLDGSGSMRRTFGNHVHGFYGLIEIMRDWVKVVPLTGDDHNAGAAGASRDSGFRLTFIQFSKAEARPEEDHPTGCAVGQCTDGHLSGRRDELYGDLDWHEANYQAQWTYLHDALQDVADNTFTPDQSPDWRKHVVIIIADGGLTDIDGDACCEDRCGNPRCVDRNFKSSYPGALDAAQAKLRTEDVTVFGIVMRRFDYHTFQDDNAEAKLTPLVSLPSETHFMNLMLDDIPGAVLHSLCDANSMFGQNLITKHPGCASSLDQGSCLQDAACVWESAACTESVCYPLCSDTDCNANPSCTWAGSHCEFKPPAGCTSKDQTACKQDDTCLWDPLWADSCIDNPCRPPTDEPDCLSVFVTMPVPCDAPAGDPDFCKLDVCDYDGSRGNKCEVKECLKISQTTCEAEDGCVWNAPSPIPSTASPSDKVGYCSPVQCKHDTQMDCDQDALCLWDGMGSRCVEAPCTKHKNEVDCDHDMSCHWDVTTVPAICSTTVCAVHTAQDPCDADSQCQWDASNVCVPKNCNKHADQCPCDADSDCVWHHAANGAYCTAVQFNACPDLDIAFVLDGSGSMRRTFGNHAHGFYGLIEIMRDWVKIVPLTGDDHNAGAAGASRDSGFRLTFIQFSKAEARPDEDHPTGCAVGQCTDGHLSGRRDELYGDLDWHEANYQAQWTYLHDALQDVADNTFTPDQSPDWREHVVIIVADGGLTDINGDACCEDRCGNPRCVDRNFKSSYPGALDAAQAKLRTEDVTVFGIVMRRFDYHTFQDDNAEAKLTPLVAQPTYEHFMNLMLDEIAGTVLTKLCDSNSVFGKSLAKTTAPGCAASLDQGSCLQDAACVWESAACTESVCYPLCSDTDCNANPSCTWAGSHCEFKPPAGCTSKDQTACKQDDTCLWDPLWADSCIDNPCRPPTDEPDCLSVFVTMPVPCDAPAGDPDFCKLDVCDYDGSRGNKCEVKECLKISQTTCEAEDGCVWNAPSPIPSTASPSDKVGYCSPVQCKHDTQMDCDQDALCLWDGMGAKCVETECTMVKDETKCDHQLACHWDVTAVPPVCSTTVCAKHSSQDPCVQDPACMFVTIPASGCVPKNCNKYTDRCPCQLDDDCVWHHAAGGAYCTAVQFNACPDLDIAFVLDGSGSMRRTFGNHAHGFYGLIEIMRDWVKIVPLTGDDHNAGAAGASRDSGFRITFIQFSKAEARPEEDHPTGCAVGQCTDGHLSGRRDELYGDLDWHEANYQAQWTYLHDALQDVADNTFTPDQSPDWREHVVIIVADGGLTDIDGDACCNGACGTCVDRKWKASYPSLLDAAQADLRAEDVTVFGIVMRRFSTHSFDDENAEAKLKPLVSNPVGDHFLNLMLDDIPGSVLQTLCDPSSKFGKVLAKTPLTCADLSAQQDCELDKACLWDGACTENVCYDLCSETSCVTNRKCYWNGQNCDLAPDTGAPATSAPPTAVPPTPLPATDAPSTQSPATDAPATSAPPTMPPATETPPTDAPTPAPTPEPLTDECVDNKDTCGGQNCQDPNQNQPDDWKCVCPPPNQHISNVGGQADCTTDECETNDVTCKQQAQQCLDPSKSTPDDWHCVCIAPQTMQGSPVAMQPAVCVDPPGDCKVNGDVCHSVGQTCDPGTDTSNGKYECKCIPPAVGNNGANAPADCILDECVAVCKTCNTKVAGGGQTCEDVGQECEDLNTSPTSLHDWRCKCPPPQTGAATAKPATCDVDECKVICPTCADKDGNGNICVEAGQSCVEKSLRTLSDWECVCQDPKIGRQLIAVAVCDEDECRTKEQICFASGQTCDDPDVKTPGTWACTCPPPSNTTAIGMAAQCEEDECTVNANRLTCEDAGQVCVDKSATSKDDWMCQCPPPASGTQTLGPVLHCLLDECEVVCPTCADQDQGNVCTENNQVCRDPVTTTASLSDWTCTCKVSGKFAVAAPVDMCTDELDECREFSGAVNCTHLDRYTQDGCLCACGWTALFSDGNGNPITLPPGPGSSEPCTTGCCNPNGAPEGDWCYVAQSHSYNKDKPHCMATRRQACSVAGSVPQDGGKAPRPAIPGVPSAMNNVCTDAGQLCVDPNKQVSGDWQCQCVQPASGGVGLQQPADCGMDECVTHAATCTARHQTCVDDNTAPSSLDNWYCVCTSGATKARQLMAPATCELDECIEICPTCAVDNAQNICTAVGQVCEDPKPTDDSLSDWMCKCAAPATGVQVAGPVDNCILDECVVLCPTCADKDDGKGNLCASAGQECEDKDKSVSSRSDWVCRCALPSHTFAVTNVAVCESDECEDNGGVCPNGQLCVDPDETKSGDWYCDCVAPAVGSSVNTAAACEEDECMTHSETCMTHGQACLDPDVTTLNTWICTCVAPDKGVPGQQTPASCLPPQECLDNEHICTAVDQHCTDPNPSTTGDWECSCIPPYKGTAVQGAPADCVLDECVEVCTTCQQRTSGVQGVCELHGQTCEDPDLTRSGNWVCKCVAPSTGSATPLGAAVCKLDECVAVCPTCAGTACTDAGQECEDLSRSPKHLSDWVCKCPPPSRNVHTAGPVAACTDDECTTFGSACTAAGQICVDPDTTATGDWECHCTPPASGAQQGALVDTCLLNECAAICPTCADRDGRGNICQTEDQECVDPDHSVSSNWYCKCTIGTSYQVGGVVPSCMVDECSTECETCANKGGGNVCEAVGQECVDVNTEGYSTGDWQCRCPAPLQAIFSSNAAAVCSLDECTSPVNGKIPGQLCTDAGQLCHDSHLDNLGDFDCVCPPPRQGTHTAAPATCTTDECLIHGDECKKANQTCIDPDVFALNDWECVCPQPSSASRKLGAAVCELDECVQNRWMCSGASPPQDCVDNNKTRNGDWRCVCLAPSSGSAVASIAQCALDECVGQCATCAKTTCSAAGQTCTDPNPTFRSVGDWVCNCPAPSTLQATASAAQCPTDECDRAEHVCLASRQQCVDPNTAGDSLGDWECRCPLPASGSAVKGPALCLVDECMQHGHVCTERGQMCADPHKGVDSLDDWECHCVAPSTGAAMPMKAAECILVGECEDPTVSDVCTSAGQVCDDPDKATAGDWRCRCVPPATGVPGSMGAAVCKLDECVSLCPTCAMSTCTDAGQQCVDEDTHPVTGLGTWECRCRAPSSGAQRNAAAVCVVDECEVHRSTCTTVNQDCRDADNTRLGDWECVCRAPLKGLATATVAACRIDECELHGDALCGEKGQTCSDPDTSGDALGDWTCNCVAPWYGTAVAQTASCKLDECVVHGSVCEAAGQHCIDQEPTLEGFWYCFCPPPQERTRRNEGPAECTLDECVVNGVMTAMPPGASENLCEAVGQTCFDPNQAQASLGDWQCICPETNSSAVAEIAACEIDECLDAATKSVCAGQLCFDWDWAATDTWECRCVRPAEGLPVQGGLASCFIDECITHEATCHTYGQLCVDDDTETEDTWKCQCPVSFTGSSAVKTGSALMGPADCTPAESECKIAAVAAVCHAKGQLCIDPDVATLGNWECECLEPATGIPEQGAPAICVLDECVDMCATCAFATCTGKQQLCVDPNTDGSSLGDWMCKCASADHLTGTAVGKAALCELDECEEVCATCADHGSGNTCTRVGTLCEDPNKDARSVSDWICVCKPPANARRTLGIPVCAVDECALLANEGVCGDAQLCVDPNTDAASLNDFECRCPGGQIGVGLGRAAQCILNECNIEEVFRTCEEQGQVCIDPKPTPAFREDWECHCSQGDVFAVAAAATCVLDECASVCLTCADHGGGNICANAGQTCTDPNTSPDSTGDWTCTCAASDVSAVANVATCQVDECTDVTNFGAITCNEVPRTTTDGCACECGWRLPTLSFIGAGPGIDSNCDAGCCNPTGRAGGAWCKIDATDAGNLADPRCMELLALPEAEQIQTCTQPPSAQVAAVQNVCQDAQQTCVDPDTSAKSIGDWRCECVAPAFGQPSVRGPASCVINECESEAARVCALAGQLCVDPSQSLNDWTCVCPKGAKGEGAQKAATCEWYGECAENVHTCQQVGQACFDPDVSVTGDWVCQCVAPAIGVSAHGGPASCTLDECLVQCATCADKGAGNICSAAGQICAEGSTSPGDIKDWRCVCPPGQDGSRALAAAECMVDECLENNRRLEAFCATSGQSCVDPNTKVSGARGDWQCVCALPAMGVATGRVASCILDECKDPKIAEVCMYAVQSCEDPNHDSLVRGDWRCRCEENGVVKTAIASPADCAVPEDNWCFLFLEKCSVEGQVCISTPPTGSTGKCACVAPQVGEPVEGGPAVCVLDECTATCPTCADSGNGNLCEKNGQVCVEGSTTPSATSDWQCQCVGESTTAAVASVARCVINECDSAGKVCLSQQQACTDPNTADTVLGDWFCTCHDPAIGKQVGGVATCIFDECLLFEKQCAAQGQTCHDPNTAVDKQQDWQCECVTPATGSATGAPAVCTYVGECDSEEIRSVCTNAGQSCHDPDSASLGDWECRCVSPQAGDAVRNAPARCTLDECKVACTTCATKPGSQTHACTSAGQTCEDPNTDGGSLGDWRCSCVAPKEGQQRAATAVCRVDECAEPANRRRCAEAVDVKGQSVQLCYDPDAATEGDWQCVCAWPYSGAPGERELAACRLDECSADRAWLGGPNGNEICSEQGQLCVDPQQDVDKLNNWLCQCPNPNDGVATGAPVAQCATGTLCSQHGGDCQAGQMCVERNDEWYCKCVAPLVGEMRSGHANCVLDECQVRCETCAQKALTHTCVGAGQTCIDPDTSDDSLSDWYCECKVGKGSATGAAAVCTIDECDINAAVCESLGQTCTDPDTGVSSSGDWVCQCVAPNLGSAVAGPASCLRDECVEHSHVCLKAGQSCVDQSQAPHSLGDWACHCPEPATGSMISGPASCTYTGGCKVEANVQVCAAAEQKCVPGANSTAVADWRCACLPPYHSLSLAERAPAVCVVNECDDICPSCARKSTNSENVCTIAGQGCVDPNIAMESLNDWMCMCRSPATATAVGHAVEKCMVDECRVVSLTGARQCKHVSRFTLDGCECACGWQLEKEDGPGIGAGFASPCTSGCCNPTLSATGDWCLLEDNDFNRNNPKCAAVLADTKRQTCAEPGTPAPEGALLPSAADVCMERGMDCVDPDHSSSVTGDWTCVCPNGGQIDDNGACGMSFCLFVFSNNPPTVYDECKNVSICIAGGQECFDPQTSAHETGDWMCECAVDSYSEGSAVGGLAECGMTTVLRAC